MRPGLIEQAADWLWPPECPVSRVRVDRHGRFAAEAWGRLNFIADPQCQRCGRPFPYPGGTMSGALDTCAPCIAKPPRYDRARAPLAYNDAVKPLVLALKNNDRRDMLAACARWMSVAAADLLGRDSLLVPVPLHWRRLAQRRYNQSALLARALGRETGLGVETGSLKRVRATPSQAGRSADGRKRNVAGAFRVEHPERIAGRPVVLVDDVLTTGATVSACVHQLRRARAAGIDVVTLCRVVREEDVTI
ncbi:ComF family protein [Maricaulis sp.]|uniref:ComF family protein n=1 Tax=Maricaulis sp. TaxID=1486257 RepID=UPI0026136CAC|nr:ComF family protein [Maricaulis sp.]